MKEVRLKILGDSAIYVGEVEVGPSASHLFALLLLLALAPPGGMSRRELQEMLFEPTDEEKANHRLRQLLYRLRTFGVVIREANGGALQIANPIAEPTAGHDGNGSSRGSANLRALPHYAPRLPAPFLAWLETSRDRVEREAQSRLLRELREAHRRQDWAATSGLAEVVLVTDPLNEEVAVAGAESRAMLGQRDEALEIADRFVRELDGDEASARAMRKLRARIARTTISHRDATLRGREECLAFLAEQWSQCARGGGRLSLVVGPPGMGKSRVAEAFAAKVRLEGGRVLTYQCDRQASQHPLALFSAILPTLQAMPGSLGVAPVHRATLERLAPGGAATSNEMPGLGAVEARRTDLQRALIDLLEAVSSESPLLLIVDDAHLLDDASCEVIRTLAESENSAAVLIGCFTRPRTEGSGRLTHARRAVSYLLPPLSDDDARALIRELAVARFTVADHVQWMLSQAQGNPFYLYALASMASDRDTLPARVRSLANCAYFSLTPNARTVLESCLLLNTLATLNRVKQVAGIGEATFLNTLRELEDLDLIHFNVGRLHGPHAILDDAVRCLIPGSIKTLLHTRIAKTLSKECECANFSLPLAWAAAQSWLAAEEPIKAAELACSCARAAASLGEPHTGAELLAKIPRDDLPPDARRRILEELQQLAQLANWHSLVVTTLRARLDLAERTGEGHEALSAIKLATIGYNLQYGGYKTIPLKELEALLHDGSLTHSTRAHAAQRLLAYADVEYDTELARATFSYLDSISSPAHAGDPYLINARLIFHTTFGNVANVVALQDRLTELLESSIPDDARHSLINNLCFASIRIGHYEFARDTGVQIFNHCFDRGILSAAEYALSGITNAEISLGNFDNAAKWLERWEAIASRRANYRGKYYPGYASTKFFVALHMRSYEEAEQCLATYNDYGLHETARYRAIGLAHAVILNHRRGSLIPSHSIICELYDLFERGKSFGAQDSNVEALWCALTASGKRQEASAMLGSYLCHSRRETTWPESSLARTTAIDAAWATSPYGLQAVLTGSRE